MLKSEASVCLLPQNSQSCVVCQAWVQRDAASTHATSNAHRDRPWVKRLLRIWRLGSMGLDLPSAWL